MRNGKSTHSTKTATGPVSTSSGYGYGSSSVGKRKFWDAAATAESMQAEKARKEREVTRLYSRVRIWKPKGVPGMTYYGESPPSREGKTEPDYFDGVQWEDLGWAFRN